MQNLTSLLNQELSWIFSKKKITLKSNAETIVELIEVKSNKATFILDGKNYSISNHGFWNAKTVIEQDAKQTLILKRNFLGSKGVIEFENGRRYFCKIFNDPLAKLSFMDMYEKEILYYKLEASPKPKTILRVVDHSINEYEMLMLIILGCYSFKGIVSENNDSDFIVLISGV